MTGIKKISIKGKGLTSFILPLGEKNMIIIKGSKGYIMCGYLDLTVAEKFKEVAVKITGVNSIEEAVCAKVFSCTSLAEKKGIYKGQSIKDVLEIIA